MPLYEYFCPTCKESFETLRPAAQADRPTTCPSCQTESSQRILSLVASSVMKGNGSSSAGLEMSAPSMGGGCCGGACGCHH
jgi:putative FmdB family regulatory protein